MRSGREARRERVARRDQDVVPRYQRRWLVAYWMAAGFNVLFVALAVTGSDVPGAALFAVLTGAVATVAGSLMATRLARRGVSSVDFDDASSAMRIVVVAWALLAVSMVVIMLVATALGERASAGQEALDVVADISDGVAAQLFGAAALFVVVGDGYTKYRRLLSTNRRVAGRGD